jgi:signal transduction histidine kinase
VQRALRDHSGTLWFVTSSGISRLIPASETTLPAPTIWITSVQIMGAHHRVSEMGESDIQKVRLGADRNLIEIEYTGLDFRVGSTLRYKYKLDNVDPSWSIPTTQRAIHFARLAPGDYNFAVQAITSDGATSVRPATVGFTVIAPIWRQSWFLALTGLAASFLLAAAYRYRVGRLLELERVRTRIASDLHDDIGSNLSQVAILAELVRRGMSGQDAKALEQLDQIAATSRETVESIGDIVWSIHPDHDHVADLGARMRHFATSVFTARDIKFDFHAPGRDLKLEPQARSQVFMIFKEAVHNIARHARCSYVDIRLVIYDGELIVTVSDNGIGIRPTPHAGNGLANMRRRAELLRGTLVIASNAACGVKVTLKVPIANSNRAGWRRWL